MSIDGIGRGQGWYVELEPMKTHWLLLWRRELEIHGCLEESDLIVGYLFTGSDPTDTWTFENMENLGNIYGFTTYVKTMEDYLEEDMPAYSDYRLTYEKVHANVWQQLRQRRIILAKRRKKS